MLRDLKQILFTHVNSLPNQSKKSMREKTARDLLFKQDPRDVILPKFRLTDSIPTALRRSRILTPDDYAYQPRRAMYRFVVTVS